MSFSKQMDCDAGTHKAMANDFINNNDMDIYGKNKCNYSLSHCAKSQHHGRLIPVSEMKREDLPTGFRKQELLEYVRRFSSLVVKITVRSTSVRRTVSVKYYVPASRTQEIVRQGTGWVAHVLEDDIPEMTPCPCSNCRFSNKPHEVVGPIYVMTARHLVYDQSEALNTEIDFTNDECEKNLAPAWKAEGVDVMYQHDEDRDFVVIKCYSHDLNVFSHLKSTTDAFLKSTKALLDTEINNCTSGKDCAFIIAHPHGRSKHVSFGTVLKKEIMNDELNDDGKSGEIKRGIMRYTYDIPTCPGSSGAAVCVMGTDGASYYQFPHSVGSSPIKPSKTKLLEEEKDEELGMNYGLVEWLND